MEESINERIKKVISKSNCKSVRQFAIKIGIAQTSLNDVVRNGAEPKFSTIDKIIKAEPLISPEWLLTGKGEMLKSGYTQTDGVISVANEAQGEYQVQRKFIPLVTDLSATCGVPPAPLNFK